MSLNRTLFVGMALGALWGIGILGLAEMTGGVTLEGTAGENLLAFGAAGSLLGLFLNALLHSREDVVRKAGPIVSGIILAVVLWGGFVLAGMAASDIRPERFHFHGEETIRGGILVGILGLLLGWSRRWGIRSPGK